MDQIWCTVFVGIKTAARRRPPLVLIVTLYRVHATIGNMKGTPLHPMPDYVLVELASSKYAHVEAPSRAYEGKNSGLVVSIGSDYPEDHKLVGKIIYWQEFREGSPITVANKNYAFVKLEDIQGYSDAPSD